MDKVRRCAHTGDWASHTRTLAVGDSENDRAMLQKAGEVAAVMANGMPEIRALAHLVSKAGCDHDGVAEYWKPLASDPVLRQFSAHFFRFRPVFVIRHFVQCIQALIVLVEYYKDGLFVYTSTISACMGYCARGASPTPKSS